MYNNQQANTNEQVSSTGPMLDVCLIYIAHSECVSVSVFLLLDQNYIYLPIKLTPCALCHICFGHPNVNFFRVSAIANLHKYA